MPIIPDTGSVSLAFEEKRVSWDVIRKQPRGKGFLPNLRDYDAVREAFT